MAERRIGNAKVRSSILRRGSTFPTTRGVLQHVPRRLLQGWGTAGGGTPEAVKVRGHLSGIGVTVAAPD